MKNLCVERKDDDDCPENQLSREIRNVFGAENKQKIQHIHKGFEDGTALGILKDKLVNRTIA